MVRFRHASLPGLASALLLLLFACAGPRSSSSEASSPQIISSQEIEAASFSLDLYSLVQRIRPNWLKKSGPHSILGGDDIRVYVNGMRYADPSALRFYQAMDVESLRFLDPGPATVRFGVGHSHGAIVVRLRGGGDPTS